jgi:hypothetical protein
MCEKPTNRLFCTSEHHTLYRDGWQELIKFINTEQGRKYRVMQHLGIKVKGDDDDDDENEIVLSVAQLEHLPDEVIGEILRLTFPDVGGDIFEATAASRARLMSVRMRRLVDEYVFDPVERLEDRRLYDEPSVLLLNQFRGLKELKLDNWQDGIILGSALSQMTRLEELALHDVLHISDKVLHHLTNLRSLTIRNTLLGNSCLSTLTRLEMLTLRENYAIDDRGLLSLPQLRKLFLSFDYVIKGTCFAFFTKLESLRIEYCSESFAPVNLSVPSLVSTLVDLSLFGPLGNGDHYVLPEMPVLRGLSLVDNNNIVTTDEELSRFTLLTRLDLSENTSITGKKSFPRLRNLTELDLSSNTSVTPDVLRSSNLRHQLKVLKIGRYGRSKHYRWPKLSTVEVRDVVDFPKLEKLYLSDFFDLDSDFIDTLRERGVTVESS